MKIFLQPFLSISVEEERGNFTLSIVTLSLIGTNVTDEPSIQNFTIFVSTMQGTAIGMFVYLLMQLVDPQPSH